VLVSADDAVRDLSVSIRVPARCLHSEHLCPHRHVLRQGSHVFTVLKDWRIVVDVQDGDQHVAQRGQTWGALVTGPGLQLVCGLHLSVQGALQAHNTGVLVN